jgi:HSP20 family protein
MPLDPARDLLTMQERLENLFGRSSPGWVPAADLFETREQFILSIELPGLCRSDVQIAFTNSTLTVSGQRPAEAPCERYQQFERPQGRFSRHFQFAVAVDQDQISAELTDGVLTVVIPKTAAPPVRRIDIE